MKKSLALSAVLIVIGSVGCTLPTPGERAEFPKAKSIEEILQEEKGMVYAKSMFLVKSLLIPREIYNEKYFECENGSCILSLIYAKFDIDNVVDKFVACQRNDNSILESKQLPMKVNYGGKEQVIFVDYNITTKKTEVDVEKKSEKAIGIFSFKISGRLTDGEGVRFAFDKNSDEVTRVIDLFVLPHSPSDEFVTAIYLETANSEKVNGVRSGDGLFECKGK